MDPQPLFLKNRTRIKAHLCGKCNRLWLTQDGAERCCRCSWCGDYCGWTVGNTAHEECSQKYHAEAEAKALEAAVLVPDYAGPFLFGDNVHMSVADLLEAVELEDIPDFGYCTKYEPPVLDMNSLMEDMSEKMPNDWDPNQGEAQDPLIAAIEAWNAANKDNGAYWEDRKRKWSKADLLGEGAAVKEEGGGDDE